MMEEEEKKKRMEFFKKTGVCDDEEHEPESEERAEIRILISDEDQMLPFPLIGGSPVIPRSHKMDGDAEENWNKRPREGELLGGEQEGMYRLRSGVIPGREIYYTDGSAKDGRCGYAIIRKTPSGTFEVLKSARGFGPNQTNNEAELQAVLEVLVMTQGRPVTIRTDSKFAKGWVERLLHERVPRKELVRKGCLRMLLWAEKICSERQGRKDVKIEWVRGHQKGQTEEAVGNRMADKYADEGRRKEASTPPEAISTGVRLFVKNGSSTTDNFRPKMKTCAEEQRIGKVTRCRKNSVLLMNILSGNAWRNMHDIIARINVRGYVSMMTKKFLTADILAHIEAKQRGVEVTEEAKKCACGRKDGYNHMICQCPKTYALQSEDLSRLTEEQQRKLAAWARGFPPSDCVKKTLELLGDGHVRGNEFCLKEGGSLDVEVAIQLLIRASRTGSPMSKFAEELRQMMQRYSIVERSAQTPRSHDQQNEWAVPWRLSSAFADAYRLTTILFAHPANVDPTYGEYCTGDIKDQYFGAQYDAFEWIRRDQDLLAWANPPYDQDVMDRLWTAVEGRAKDERHAFRIVLTLPFDEGKPNELAVRRLQKEGLDVRVIQTRNTFAFWKPHFWRNRDYGRYPASFRVGFVLVQNHAAELEYPTCEKCCRNVISQMEMLQDVSKRRVVTYALEMCHHSVNRELLRKMSLLLWEKALKEAARLGINAHADGSILDFASCEVATRSGIMCKEVQKAFDDLEIKLRVLPAWSIREWRLRKMKKLGDDEEGVGNEEVDLRKRLYVRFEDGRRMVLCVRASPG